MGTRFAESDAVLFQIDAVAEEPPATTVEQLRKMLQSVLIDRFKLTLHWNSQEVPGFALVLAKNGLKLKLKKESDSEEPPNQEGRTGRVVLKGRSGMAALADWIGASPGSVKFIAPVSDKTLLTGIYDYELVLSNGATPGQRGQSTVPPQERPSLAELNRTAADTLSDQLEGQLGLRLQPEKSVLIRILVIDHVEKPVAN